MIKEASIWTLYILYFSNALSYHILGFPLDTYYVATALSIIFLSGALGNHTLSEESNHIVRFIAHLTFLSLTISTIWGILATIYSIVFYFGFFKTVMNTFLIAFLLLGEFIQSASEFLNQYSVGKKIVEYATRIYDASSGYSDFRFKLLDYALHLYTTHGIEYMLIAYDKILDVHDDFGNNNLSRRVADKLSARYDVTKGKLLKDHFQPYFFKLIESSMGACSFENMDNDYKVNTSMSKFENISLDTEVDNFEDSEDEVQLTQPAVVAVPIANTVVAPQPISAEAHRQALRKKIAAKKNARMNRNRQMQANMNAKPPNMNKLMESMMTGDNMKKIAEMFPNGKMDPNNLSSQQMETINQLMQDSQRKN